MSDWEVAQSPVPAREYVAIINSQRIPNDGQQHRRALARERSVTHEFRATAAGDVLADEEDQSAHESAFWAAGGLSTVQVWIMECGDLSPLWMIWISGDGAAAFPEKEPRNPKR